MTNSTPPPLPPQAPYAHAQTPYGAPMYVAAPPRTNGLAIATFILGLCGFALLPVILGHISLGQIKRRGDGGMVFAVIGLVLGYLACVAYLILGIVLAASLGFVVLNR